MKKILILFVLIVQSISIKAEKCTHIRMNNDGTVQTASGTIYRLFQSEMFSVDSTNVLSIFSDRASINSTTQKEPYLVRIEDAKKSPLSKFLYISTLIMFTLIICIVIYIYNYWRRSNIHKLIEKPEMIGLNDEQLVDNRKLRKECSDLSSQLTIIEKKFRDEHIRRMHLEKDMVLINDIIAKKEKENESLKMEIKKCNDRIYSIENKLKKAEYDNRQLEEKLSQDKA